VFFFSKQQKKKKTVVGLVKNEAPFWCPFVFFVCCPKSFFALTHTTKKEEEFWIEKVPLT
jgi:hypothetical protein